MSGLDIDTRTDIYSLGVLLYELLTGVTPFDKETLAKAALDEIRRMIRETEPPKPSTRLTQLAKKLTRRGEAPHATPADRREVRGDLDWIVMKALEKDRRRRYETANDLAEDIQRHLEHEPVLASPPSAAYRTRKFVRRHRVGVVVGAVVTLALVAGLSLALVGLQRAFRAETAARRDRDKSRQVARFLEDMLVAVGPAAARGRDTGVLREILDGTASRVGNELKDQPEVAAELQNTIAEVYRQLREFDKADATFLQALSARRRVLGPEHPAVAASLDGLARLYEARKVGWPAERLHREALLIRRKTLGNEHPDTIASLAGVARACYLEDKIKECERVHREVLALQRKVLGESHPDVATTIDDLAFAFVNQGQIAEAERLEREALARRRKLFTNDHPDLAYSIRRMGLILQVNGKLAEAEALHREVLEMRKRLFGKEAPWVYSVLGSLEKVLRAQGKLAEADARLSERRELRGKALGIRDQAQELLQEEKVAEAVTLYREAAERGDRVAQVDLAEMYDEGHYVAKDPTEAARRYRQAADQGDSDAKLRLARMYALGQGVAKDEAEAMRWYQKAAEALDADLLAWKYAAVLGPELRDGRGAVLLAQKAVAATGRRGAMQLDALAAAYAEAGQFTNAVNAEKEALALVQDEALRKEFASRLRLYESGLPYHDEKMLACRTRFLLSQGKFAEAEASARECLALWEKTFPDDPGASVARSDLGLALLAQDKYAEAEVAFREGMATSKKLFGSKRSNTARVRNRLADALQLQGKRAEIVKLYEEAAAEGADDAWNDLAWILATAVNPTARDGVRAVAIAEKAVAASQRKNAATLDTLAAAYAEAGQFTNAVNVQKEAIGLLQGDRWKKEMASHLRLYESGLPYRDPDLLVTRTSLLLDEGKFAEAEPLARECLTLRQILIPDDWRTFNTRTVLGGSLLGQNKYTEAEPLLVSGYEGMEQRAGKIPAIGKPRLKEALQRLVQLYEETGRPGRAAAWKQKLAEFEKLAAENKAAQ